MIQNLKCKEQTNKQTDKQTRQRGNLFSLLSITMVEKYAKVFKKYILVNTWWL